MSLPEHELHNKIHAREEKAPRDVRFIKVPDALDELESKIRGPQEL